MKYVGEKGKVNKVKVTMNSPEAGDIDVTTVSVTNSVGAIPQCKVFFPIEFLSKISDEQTDNLYTVKVSDPNGESFTLFTGYVLGDKMSVSGNSIAGGVELIHPARDLDEARIIAPGLHPSSSMDFTSVFRMSESASASGLTFSGEDFYTSGGGPIAKQIIDGLIKSIDGLISITSDTRGASGATLKALSLNKSKELLGRVQADSGTLDGEIESALMYGDGSSSLNDWIAQRVMFSVDSGRSVWDVLTSVFSQIGIFLLCDNEGGIRALPDCSFFGSTSNTVEPDKVIEFDSGSLMPRNVGEVCLASDNIKALSAYSGAGEGDVGIFVSYPEEPENGATLIMQMPGWLSPLAQTGNSKIVEAQKKVAESFYRYQRNRYRTMSVDSILAPNALPGTVAKVIPASKVKARSGQEIEDIKIEYTGYCFQVVHTVDSTMNSPKALSTRMNFSNVSRGGSNTTSSHPVFSDAQPIEWK